MSTRADGRWWLISNCHGGIHRAEGATAADAKAAVRAAIAETFQSEGGCRPATPAAAPPATAFASCWARVLRRGARGRTRHGTTTSGPPRRSRGLVAHGGLKSVLPQG